jgi:hypothetical protein
MNMKRRWQILGALLLTLGSSTALTAQPGPEDGVLDDPPTFHEIDIEFENARGPEIPVEPPSGWPLTLILTANDALPFGLGTASGFRQWPHQAEPPNVRWRPGDRVDDAGFLVFQDPEEDLVDHDNWCPSWLNRYFLEDHLRALESWDPNAGTEPPVLKNCPVVDPWIELTPGRSNGEQPADGEPCYRPEISAFEPQDVALSDQALAKLADDFEIPPDELKHLLGANTFRIPFGVCGGPNPRLPSLVLLADQGGGVVLDEDLEPSSPLQLRNLAPLLDSVAYEIKDSHGRTRIVAQANVHGALFTPIVLFDDFVSCPPASRPCQETREKILPHDHTGPVTLRAFVVQGRAPATLGDENGDGRVDIQDAQDLGLRLLSGEAIFEFVQSVDDADEVHFRIPVDFDGNGLALKDTAGPPSPGRLTPPPE